MKDPLRPIVWELYRAASNRTVRGEAAYKRNHVAWQIRKDGWVTVRKCSVTQYSPGCIRFRNDLDFDIPKRVWPLRDLPENALGRMEITIHESEISALLPLIVEIAEGAGREYQSPLFPDGRISPSYAWSIKANQQHRENEKMSAERRSKRSNS
jgi:hypothetical protein